MKSISLVCTIHDENGRANIQELCAILEHIRPEVIFLETPRDALDEYLNGRTSNKLESAAVRQYCATNSARPIPVDLPTPEERFFRDWEFLQERLKNKSSELKRLLMWYGNYVHDHGFDYLNSEHCSGMWADIYADMRSVLSEINDQKLSEIFESWNRMNELRENEMLRNIEKYCSENAFERGGFLIGAAHRQSLISKSTQWDLSWIASRSVR